MKFTNHFLKRGSALFLSCAVAMAAAAGCQSGESLTYKDFFELQKSYLISRFTEQSGAWFKTFGSDSTSRTISLSADLKGTPLEQYQVFFDKSAVAFAVDLSEKQALYSGELVINGEHLFGAAGSLDEKQVTLSLPDANNAFYSMDTKTLFDRFSKGAVTTSDFLRKPLTEKEVQNSLEAFLNTLGTAVTEETITIALDQAVPMQYGDQKELKCAVLTYTPEKESLTSMLKKLADLIETDQIISSLARYVNYEEKTPKVISAAEIAEKLRTNAEAYADKLISSGFRWNLAVDGKEIRRSSFVIKEEEVLAAELHGSQNTGGETVLYSPKDNTFLIDDKFTVKDKNRTGTVVLSTKNSDADVAYDISLENYSALGVPEGTYNVTVTTPQTPVSANITVSRNDDGSHLHKIDVKSSSVGFTVNLNASASADIKMPEGTPTDITNYTDAELKKLVDEVSTALAQNIYPLLMKLGLVGY